VGGGGHGQRLDDAGQLSELLGDAVALTGQERHLGPGLLDDTPRLRPQVVGLLTGGGHEGGALGACSAELLVGGALLVEDVGCDLLAQGPRSLLGLGEAMPGTLVGLRRRRLGLLTDAGSVALALGPGLLSLAGGAGQRVFPGPAALLGLVPGVVPLLAQPVAQPAGDVEQALARTAYDRGGVAVGQLTDAVGLGVGGGQQRLDRLLGPGRLLGRGAQLALGLGLGRGEALESTGVRLAQDLLGLRLRRRGVGVGGRSGGIGVGLGAGPQGGGLVLGRGDHLLGDGGRLGGARLDQVAGLGVLLVGTCLGAGEHGLRVLLRLLAGRLGGGQRVVVPPLPRARAFARGLLGLGHDLVVMARRGLHQHLCLLPGVADDLLGVDGGVVEQALGPVARAGRLSVVCRGLVTQALRLGRERLRVLLGPRLELVGHPLGMTQQRGGAITAGGLGGRVDGTVLHGGHGCILANEQPLR
jgi:hypothetical protein